MSQVNSKSPAPVPLVSLSGSSPQNTSHAAPGLPGVHGANATRPDSRDGIQASALQPGMAKTPEAIEAGVRHAKMEATIAAGVKPLPMPGTMAFNDAQTQHWAAHTRLPDTPAVAKARMLATIAQDQADAGIEFKEQLKPAEAQRLLEEAERAQASLAALASNPISTVVQMAQDSLEWLASTIFGGTETMAAMSKGIHDLTISVVTTTLENAFVVHKSEALLKLEQQGGKANRIVFAVMDDDHDGASPLNMFKSLLRAAFDMKGGDYLLAEVVKFDESGRQMLAREGGFSCYGIPHEDYENCEYLKEPALAAKVYLEYVALEKQARAIWDELVGVFPTEAAEMARREYQAKLREATRANTLSLNSLNDLIIRHTRLHTHVTKHAGVRARVNAHAERSNKLADEFRVASAHRTNTYWREIGTKLQTIRGNLFTFMGAAHGPQMAVERGYNKLSDFNGAAIPAFYLSMKRGPASRKDL